MEVAARQQMYGREAQATDALFWSPAPQRAGHTVPAIVDGHRPDAITSTSSLGLAHP